MLKIWIFLTSDGIYLSYDEVTYAGILFQFLTFIVKSKFISNDFFIIFVVDTYTHKLVFFLLILS